MEENDTGICVLNSVEMYLLHDCEDLVSMQRKIVSVVTDAMLTNPSQENHLFGKLSNWRFPVCCYIQFT